MQPGAQTRAEREAEFEVLRDLLLTEPGLTVEQAGRIYQTATEYGVDVALALLAYRSTHMQRAGRSLLEPPSSPHAPTGTRPIFKRAADAINDAPATQPGRDACYEIELSRARLGFTLLIYLAGLLLTAMIGRLLAQWALGW